MTRITLSTIGMVAALIACNASAATLIVDNGAMCSDSTGAPYCTIQAAVDTAASGDTINIAAGTYTASDWYVVDIDKSLTLIGAGRDSTIIDGEDERGGIFIAHLDAGPQLITVSISGVSIRNGVKTVSAPETSGAGVHNQGALNISDCAVTDNIAAESGGGIFSGSFFNTALTVSNCEFARNKASGHGTFLMNFIYQYGGGAIYAHGVMDVSDSVFTSNEARDVGGAIFLDQTSGASNGTVTNSTFSANQAFAGAAILTRANLFRLEASTLSGNRTINDSEALGGGLYAQTQLGAETVIINSTLSGNFSQRSAGGVFNSGGTMRIHSSTLYNNRANVNSGNIGNSSGATMTITNSIVTHAAPSLGLGPDCSGDITSLGYNLISSNKGCTFSSTTGDLVGTETSTLDAKLAGLADNGGTTQTHAPYADSPVVDAGDPGGCTDGADVDLTTDQRGSARHADDNNDGTVRCNIGAYEGVLAEKSPDSGSAPASGSNGSNTTTSSGGGGAELALLLITLIGLMRRRS